MKKDSLEKKIAAYVTLAAAYMAAHPVDANAQIIYTNVNPDFILHNNSFFNLDLNNDGVTDYKLHGDNFMNCTGGSYGSCDGEVFAFVDAQSNNQLMGGNSVSKLNAGDTITPNNNWGQGHVLFYQHTHMSWGYSNYGQSVVNSSSSSYGSWAAANNNYIGLRIKVGSDYYYGWARLTAGLTLKDFAYYDSPNHPILAGETDCGANNPAIVVTPDTIVCEGYPITLSFPSGSMDTIKWSDGTSVFGVNFSSVPITQPGNYYAIFTYPLCTDTSAAINLSFVPYPSAAIIYLNDSLLTSPAPNVHYQWYYWGNPIPNSDYYFYIPLQSGYYHVVATNELGCYTVGNWYNVSLPNGIESPFTQNEFQFSVEHKKLLFHLSNNALIGAQIDIVNELGQLAASVTVTNQSPSADLSALSGGIYFYHIRSKQKTYSGKFIIE